MSIQLQYEFKNRKSISLFIINKFYENKPHSPSNPANLVKETENKVLYKTRPTAALSGIAARREGSGRAAHAY